MERKPVSDPALAALGTFQGNIERNAGIRQQALDHNLGRNLRVCKLLAYLALLRQAGVKVSGAVECIAAIRQNFSSSRNMQSMGLPMGTMQAAHFLPGQLEIGGREVWWLATSTETRTQMEFLFAEVEHLPLAFNQADSAAEAKGKAVGLCAALVQACNEVLQEPFATKPAIGKIASELVRAGNNAWHRHALIALENAARSKAGKPGIPPLKGNSFEGYTPESISARSTASASQWNRDESLGILNCYIEDQQRSTWQWAAGRFQGALRDVESKFKG